MNTAARLQGGAPVDGIVVGETTFRATSDLFEYAEGEPVHAKGKAEPVPVWVVLGEKVAARPGAETPLVGRETELKELCSLWSRVLRERRAGLAAVLGPPGIGKSRLLLELTARAEREANVHWGRCLPYGEGMTYWPVAEILRGAAGIRHDDDAEAAAARLGELLESLPVDAPDELRTMAAALAVAVGVATTPRGTYTTTEISAAELHWGLRRVIQLLARVRPLLLVFEDLHWAEPTLLELVRSLADDDAEAPVLLVGSGRPELAEQDAGLVAPGPRRWTIELAPLGEEASARLAETLLGDAAPRGSAVETLVRNAAGNPLFLEETVRMLADAGTKGGETAAGLPVPSTLQALIGSRLDALPVAEKRVAQHASVVGATFWTGAVSHLGNGGGDPEVALARPRPPGRGARARGVDGGRRQRVRVQARAPTRRRVRAAAQGPPRHAAHALRGLDGRARRRRRVHRDPRVPPRAGVPARARRRAQPGRPARARRRRGARALGGQGRATGRHPRGRPLLRARVRARGA